MFKLIFLIFLLFPVSGLCDIITPNGEISKFYGNRIFYTEKLLITQDKNLVKIKIETNYSISNVDYNIADIKIKCDNGDTIGIKLSGKNKGDILLNPNWTTSKIFETISESCKDIDGNYIDVYAKNGITIGKAQINENKIEKDKYLITVIFSSRYFQNKKIVSSWGTAWCGNSFVETKSFIFGYDPPCPLQAYKPIINTFDNNNPVVPFYNPILPFSSGWSVGGYCDDYYGYDNCYPIIPPIPPTPPVPLPTSIAMFLFGLIRLYRKI